jgi:hypothetical protein
MDQFVTFNNHHVAFDGDIEVDFFTNLEVIFEVLSFILSHHHT